MITCVVVTIALLIGSYLVDDYDAGPDVLATEQAWLHITLLTGGHMISRGLAKAIGSQHTTN